MKKCLNVVIAITLVAALVPVAFAQQSPSQPAAIPHYLVLNTQSRQFRECTLSHRLQHQAAALKRFPH